MNGINTEGQLKEKVNIYPFNFNISQKQAVENVNKSNILVIKGTTGTGKTQTILNIIANLVANNKTIALVLGNKEATRNVKEKLDKNNDFGHYAQTIYEKLFQNPVQDLSVLETIYIRLKIVGINSNGITVNKNCIEISLDIAFKLNFSKKLNLLCENLLDCKFF